MLIKLSSDYEKFNILNRAYIENEYLAISLSKNEEEEQKNLFIKSENENETPKKNKKEMVYFKKIQ